jgi:hypothetical protein
MFVTSRDFGRRRNFVVKRWKDSGKVAENWEDCSSVLYEDIKNLNV